MPEFTRPNSLIDEAVAGDGAALERLLLDHYVPLSNYISTRLPDSIQATIGVEDIVQQTFTRVFQSIANYEPREEATFLTWLKSIADNRIRDAIRAQVRKKRGGDYRRLEPLNCSKGARATELIDFFFADEHTPSRSLARREAIQAIQIGLAGLPEEHRRAVQLHYFEGLSLEKTAEQMNRTPGSVRGLLQRAKKKMSEALVRASLYLSKK